MKAFQHITDHIIRAIETEGLLPWRKPWRAESPRNLRGNDYRGINRLVLTIQPLADPRWLTYKQVNELGGHVRRGEHGTPVMFWNEVEDEDAPEKKERLLARCSSVFNVEQTEGLQLAPASEPSDENLCSTVAALTSSVSVKFRTPTPFKIPCWKVPQTTKPRPRARF